MRRTVAFGTVLAVLVVFGGWPPQAEQSNPAERRLTRAALEDKIRGGWTGQMVGVAWGQETEFKAMGRI